MQLTRNYITAKKIAILSTILLLTKITSCDERVTSYADQAISIKEKYAMLDKKEENMVFAPKSSMYVKFVYKNISIYKKCQILDSKADGYYIVLDIHSGRKHIAEPSNNGLVSFIS